MFPHYSGGNENLGANVSKITNSDNHPRFEILPEKPGDSCPRKPACLKPLAFNIVTIIC